MTGERGLPTVLLVENDPSVTRMRRIAPGAAWFGITQVDSGAEALQALDRGPADAVVLDPGLPDGQGGTVLRRLRCAGENVPVPTWVAFSVMDRAEVNRTYGDLGDRFLRTPFDPWQLVKPLESLLKEVNGASGRREATKLEEEAGHVLAQELHQVRGRPIRGHGSVC